MVSKATKAGYERDCEGQHDVQAALYIRDNREKVSVPKHTGEI